MASSAFRWADNPRLRAPLLLASVLGVVGGLMIAYGAYASRPREHGGIRHVFTSGFVWVGMGMALLGGVVNLGAFLWGRRSH